MKALTISDVERVSFVLARELLRFNEPIPDFATRFPGRLESCLDTPLQSFGRKSLYPTLLDKAAILFYLMIKNHPFQNGNKRIAMTTLFVFLHDNGRWLKIDPHELYQFTMWIASSPAKAQQPTVQAIATLLKQHLVTL